MENSWGSDWGEARGNVPTRRALVISSQRRSTARWVLKVCGAPDQRP